MLKGLFTESYRKFRAFPQFTADFNTPFVSIHYGFGNSQTKTGTSVLASAGSIAPVKAFENMGQVFRIYSQAVVLDGQLYLLAEQLKRS